MARVLPDPLVGNVAPEAMRLYRALRAIPGDTLTAWMCLPLPGSDARPEFLVLHRDTTAFLISLSTIGRDEAEEIVHGSLFAAERRAPEGLALPQRACAKEFVATVLDSAAPGSAVDGAVCSLVLFPNVPHATLKQAYPENPYEDAYWLGAEHVTSEGLSKVFDRLATGRLSETVLAVLRARFTPESVMPQRFSPRRRIERRVRAELTPMLLDYDQEWWTKHRLSLPDELRPATEPTGRETDATLVTGVAGSGKSLVLLFRACNQARLRPGSRSLVLTHNRALRRELESRFGDLGAPPNVEWNTYLGWVDRRLRGCRDGFGIVQYAERDAWIRTAAEPIFGVIEPRQVVFLCDEFDWMKDRDVGTLSDYLEADRAGRGV
jgi:hypothetical protein